MEKFVATTIQIFTKHLQQNDGQITSHCIVCDFALMLVDYAVENQKSIKPNGIRRRLQEIYPAMQNKKQEDACVYLNALIYRMDQVSQELPELRYRYIKNLFEFSTFNEIRCLECDEISESIQLWLYFDLIIDNSNISSLEDACNDYFSDAMKDYMC